LVNIVSKYNIAVSLNGVVTLHGAYTVCNGPGLHVQIPPEHVLPRHNGTLNVLNIHDGVGVGVGVGALHGGPTII
jgi:hypothetical protein